MSDMIMLNLGPSAGDDVYLALGRAIAGQCPAGFAEARLDAEPDAADAALQLACTPEGGREIAVAIDPAAQVRIRELLAEVRDKGVGEDGRRWRKCTIVLRKGGRFQMDVAY